MQEALDAGAHGLHPAELLPGSNLGRRNLADESIGVGDLLHDVLLRHLDDAGERAGALELLQHGGVGVGDEDLLLRLGLGPAGDGQHDEQTKQNLAAHLGLLSKVE